MSEYDPTFGGTVGMGRSDVWVELPIEDTDAMPFPLFPTIVLALVFLAIIAVGIIGAHCHG